MTDLAIPTSPNLAAKNLLAKLMATEDIVVEHDPRAQTASFNMDTRVLTLPVWKDLDADTLDLLIGHEVSHALHTPAGAKPLTDACNAIDRKNPMVAKDYLNVVEDARIERMIKERFPGLRRSFSTGYRDLMKRDLFGLKKIGDLKSLPLIDRINLQYKIGWLIDVPFTAAELPLAQRVAKTVTWEDVVALSKEIYDYAKEASKNNKPDPKDGGSPQDTTDDDESDAGEADGSLPNDEQGDEDGDESESKMPTDEDGDEDGDSENGDGESGDESDETEEGDGKSGEESEENEDADGTEGGNESNETDSDGDAADGQNDNADKDTEGKQETTEASDSPTAAPKSVTMQNAEDALKNMVDATAPVTYYADLPEIDKGFVVSLKDAHESLKKWIGAVQNRTSAAATAYATWKSMNGGAVQVLATEFDRRKAADAHKRMAVAETGSIDPNRLHAYRIAEDIFLQNAYVKEGKNHGIVLLLDMSGSMSGVFYDTMAQLVTLGHFCRRVNIPFAFYGFTDHATHIGEKNAPSFKKNSFGAETIRTRLVTLLQDGMKQNEFTEACGNLLLSAYSASSGVSMEHPLHKALQTIDYRKDYYGVDWMSLDNTPTNAALLGLPSVMEAFKRAKRVQVMNLIVLTDGEPSDDMTYGPTSTDAYRAKTSGTERYRVKTVWRDLKTRKNYNSWYEQTSPYGTSTYTLDRAKQSGLLLSIIKERVGGKNICIHLTANRAGKSLARQLAYEVARTDAKNTMQKQQQAYETAESAWKDNEWFVQQNARGFDQYIVIRSDNAVDTTDLDDVDLTDKNAIRDLRKAFTKSMAATKANRPLLTRVAELVSK
jgi:cobalamin biosynthesis protein CobT